MKKVLIGILALIMTLGLVGCGNSSNPKQEGGAETELTLENYEEYLDISFTDFTINVTPIKGGNYENVEVKTRLSYPATYQIKEPKTVIREDGNRSATYTFDVSSDGSYSEAFEFVTLFGANTSEVEFSVVSIEGVFIPKK